MIWITKSIFKKQFAVRAFILQSEKTNYQWVRMFQREKEEGSKSRSRV
jgi:hypothetical protein